MMYQRTSRDNVLAARLEASILRLLCCSGKQTPISLQRSSGHCGNAGPRHLGNTGRQANGKPSGQGHRLAACCVATAATHLALLAHTVDLLVHLCPVMEAHLTRSGDCPGDTGRVPRANAGDLQKDVESIFTFLETVQLVAL